MDRLLKAGLKEDIIRGGKQNVFSTFTLRDLGEKSHPRVPLCPIGGINSHMAAVFTQPPSTICHIII